MAIERDEESQREYYELIEEIRKELVPIRPGRNGVKIDFGHESVEMV